jgi:hypothetical protein
MVNQITTAGQQENRVLQALPHPASMVKNQMIKVTTAMNEI